MKKITFDARMVGYSGIGTYIKGLLSELLKNNDFEWTLLGDPMTLHEHPSFPQDIKVRKCSAPIYSLQEQWELAVKMRKSDLVHSPHYNASLLSKTPLVVTIHDLTHFRFPEFFGRGLKLQAAKFVFNNICKQARKIIAVSRTTKNDLMEQFKVPEEKIRVIYEGGRLPGRAAVGQPDWDSFRAKYKLPEKYLLYLGNIKPHKNIHRLLQAFTRLKQEKHIEADLALIGKIDRKVLRAPEIQAFFEQSCIHYLGQLPQQDLELVFQKAQALILPSLWEGFGLPILEAFSLSVPVACSKIPAHQEVMGEEGLYFDPESDGEIRQAICRIATEPELRQRLSEVGKSRLEKFSWQKSAQETLEVYREVLAG